MVNAPLDRREGGTCRRELNVTALACPWYKLSQSKTPAPQQLARVNDPNPNPNQP